MLLQNTLQEKCTLLEYRTLTDSEVLENYEKTVAYHKIENSK